MIHNFYRLLTLAETQVVDETVKELFAMGRVYNVTIAGDDRIERVTESISECIYRSRTPERQAEVDNLWRRLADSRNISTAGFSSAEVACVCSEVFLSYGRDSNRE